ncbi:universal stress protein [Phycicoccus sp. MAQZ13P-2]|uniref:universal stress protein n=1 Tax=Phycicoccus mangrovi TaxID=2840470 RepID=UPI001C006589|nr:universal stress protein [Phycicoccus mangrovi]MBT9256691.1 universal stress protein [Phycicoccus mangrovi]MBT9274745.1 universal stress protein [Phycicoccus mangrovi]
METVVVGVDNSDASTRAVEFAVERARHNDWKVVLVHVVPWSPYSFQTASENEHRHREKERELAAATEQVLVPMARIAEDGGVPHSEVVRHGKPSDTITDVARETGAVHVIVGRTGDGGLREAVFGSVASRLVQHAHLPVTVVP